MDGQTFYLTYGPDLLLTKQPLALAQDGGDSLDTRIRYLGYNPGAPTGSGGVLFVGESIRDFSDALCYFFTEVVYVGDLFANTTVVDEVSAVYCTNSTGQFCDYGDETMQGTAAGFSTDTWYLTAKALAAAGVTVYNGQHQFVDDVSVLLDASLLDGPCGARGQSVHGMGPTFFFRDASATYPAFQTGFTRVGSFFTFEFQTATMSFILYGRPTPLLPSAWPAFTTTNHNVHLLNTDLLGNLLSNNVQDTDSSI